MRRTFVFLLILTFFGLTSEYRSALFRQIHEVVFHGKGGYDWHTVYNMPIWLRLFTFRAIEDFYVKEQEAHQEMLDKQNNVQKATPGNSIPVPPSPKKSASYTTSVSKS